METATLRTKNSSDRIALRGVAVHADLVGMTQRTTVRQTFINLEDKPIEAVYTFPLPDGAAVCAFEIITGDRTLTGEIDETDKATETYQKAIAAGDAAFSLDRERSDVFSLRVGNLKPKQAVTIKLMYTAALEPSSGKIRFSFPTTIAPRYVSAAGTDPVDAAIDGDTLNPPNVLSVPYRLTFTADVRLGRAVSKIGSPTHEIAVTDDDHAGYKVTLPGGAEMSKELVLSIELVDSPGPSVQVETNADGCHYLAVTFAPKFESGVAMPAGENVFVIDCSGSMGGQSIVQAMAAVELCLRSLSAGDRFNICRFGSTFEMMAAEPLVYSQQTLDAAVAFVRQGANLGGTELLDALTAVLELMTTGVRNVVLMTDGQISNEPAVLALARRWKSTNRIFSFGIGTAASSSLVKGLARVTAGAAEFITTNERIDEKVLRTFARLASPAATGVAVDWGGAAVEIAGVIPPVFEGDLLTIFGRCTGPVPTQITLRCQTESGEQQWPVAVPSTVLKDFTIATSWARREIEAIEDSGERRSAVASANSPAAVRMIALSKQFGVMSTLTTFVAVEHRAADDKTAGRPESRRVPVMLADGWGGATVGALKQRSFGLSAKRSVAGGPGVYLSAPQLAPAPPPGADLLVSALPPSPSFARRSAPTVEPDAVPKGPMILREILLTQDAAGAFGWNDRIGLKVAEDSRWPEIDRAVETAFPDEIRPTVKVLILLAAGFASDEPMWKRAAAKAIRHVAAATGWTEAAVKEWVGRTAA